MGSVNLRKSLEPFFQLINLSSMSFRDYFLQACSTMDPAQIVEMRQILRERGFGFGISFGFDILASMRYFPIAFPRYDYSSIPLTRPIPELSSFGGTQLERILNSIITMEHYNTLNAAYLCPALDSGKLTIPISDGRIIELLDGLLIQNCPNWSLQLLSMLSRLEIPGRAIVQLEAVQEIKTVLNRHDFRALFNNPAASLKLISTLVKLGCIHMMITNVSRKPFNALRMIWVTFRQLSLLVDAIKIDSYKYALEVKLIHQLVKSMICLRVFDDEALAEFGISQISDAYSIIEQMIADIDEKAIDPHLVIIIPRIRIELLTLIAQFEPDVEKMDLCINHLLNVKEVLPARLMLILLWSLNGVATGFEKWCNSVASYMIASLPAGTDFSVMEDLKLTKYIPRLVRLREFRKSTRQLKNVNVVDFYTTLPLLKNIFGKEREPMHPVRFNDVSVLASPWLYATSIHDLILDFIREHFLYVGHDKEDNLPVYIPSLTTHLFIQSLFFVSLFHMATLRIRLPFKLHSRYIQLLKSKEEEGLVVGYIRFAYQVELKNRTPEQLSRKAVLGICLIEQLFDKTQEERTPSIYNIDDFESLADQYMKLEEKAQKGRLVDDVARLWKDMLRIVGRQLISKTIPDQDFSSQFSLIDGHQEAFKFLFGHA